MDDLTYVKVYTRDNAVTHCILDDEMTLDVAITRYIEKKQDELLLLTTSAAQMYKTLASEVTSWIVSTPESRERERELERRMKEEAGTPWAND